jgi:hypothetical protein
MFGCDAILGELCPDHAFMQANRHKEIWNEAHSSCFLSRTRPRRHRTGSGLESVGEELLLSRRLLPERLLSEQVAPQPFRVAQAARTSPPHQIAANS